MAMNKREREEMEALRRQIREARAMRFTGDYPPDVPPPEKSGELSRGWFPRAYFSGIGPTGLEFDAERACSSAVNHSVGRDDNTTTQGAKRLYSTRLRALLAGRRGLELRCARMLAHADSVIEKEIADSGVAGVHVVAATRKPSHTPAH